LARQELVAELQKNPKVTALQLKVRIFAGNSLFIHLKCNIEVFGFYIVGAM
jgi:hypothetical protein